jgi:acetate kinase
MILALNCGSSSLKYALFDRTEVRVLGGEVRGIGVSAELQTHAHAVEVILDELGKARAAALVVVAHRLVHGGPQLHAPTKLDRPALEELKRLTHFAPLHLPSSLAVIEAVQKRLPDVKQLGVFDTDFHWHLPEVARRLPIPRALHEQGIRRYGFHGLSYQFVSHALGNKLGARAVIAHLGSGSSLTALRDGAPIDTSMSFTPTSGIPSATRTGDLDPGILLFLLRQGVGADELEDLVSHRSGLAGISEGTGDMEKLLAARATDANAALAVEQFCMAVRKQIGALAAALGGLDALVFTGGIGAHSSEIRAEICEGLAHLGIAIDAPMNDRGAPVISQGESRCAVHVLATDEERVLARAAFDSI